MARLDEAKATLGVRYATSPFTPRVGVGSGARLHQRIPPEHRRLGAGRVSRPRRTQYLFNKPQSYAIAQAKESARGAGFASGEKSDEIAYRVASLYIDVDRAGRLADSAQKQVESLEKVLETAAGARRGRPRTRRDGAGGQRQSAAGAAASDRLAERSRLCRAQPCRRRLDTARAIVVNPAEEDRAAPAIPDKRRSRDADGAERQQGTQAAGSNYSAKGLEIKGDKAQRLPKVDLVAQYALLTKYNHYQQYFSTFKRNNGEIGASIQVPIFAGSGVRAEIEQAENDQQHIRAEVEVARNKITLDIHQSYQDIHKTDIARELAQADLDLARSQLSVILAQMNEGRASLRQVEEARFNEDEKWIAFYDAQFNAERARLNVLRQTGELMAALK